MGLSGPDIFLSYARADRTVARLFADCFEHEGFSVWWDASLHSGETFDEVIERNLRDSKAVVVLWSPNSVTSRWVRAEATQADRRNKLAPAVIEPCDRPIIFELTHAAELSDWSGDTSDVRWRTFMEDLRHLIARNSEGQEPQAQPRAATSRATDPIDKGHVARSGDTMERPVVAAPPARAEGLAADEGAEAHYLELDGGNPGDGAFLLTAGGAKIGRTTPANIVIPDSSVSREHCIVGMANDELLVTDLNSTNGTYIDGERITRATILPVGSELRIGQVSLRHAVRSSGDDQKNGDTAPIAAAP